MARLGYLHLEQLGVGGPCEPVGHKEFGEEEAGNARAGESHRRRADEQQRVGWRSAQPGQQGEQVGREQPDLSGLHQEGTQRVEDYQT